jgi:hypothetical protein
LRTNAKGNLLCHALIGHVATFPSDKIAGLFAASALRTNAKGDLLCQALIGHVATFPSDKSLGYFRSSALPLTRRAIFYAKP